MLQFCVFSYFFRLSCAGVLHICTTEIFVCGGTATEKLEKFENVVRHNLNDAWSASCKWYKRKVKLKSLEVGQTVRVYYPRIMWAQNFH